MQPLQICIGPTIRIGRESRCLPYAGFLGFDTIVWGFCVLSWWTSLLCIVGELAARGSVALAVGVADRWQGTGYRWHVAYDIWHMIHGIWFFFWLSMLLSADIERFSVSRMQDFRAQMVVIVGLQNLLFSHFVYTIIYTMYLSSWLLSNVMSSQGTPSDGKDSLKLHLHL